ncbi:MAG: TonB-dependent receptor [Bacteroidales bacterium]|nr:TonB-dependent receptor [Bacteroidales bacterium]
MMKRISNIVILMLLWCTTSFAQQFVRGYVVDTSGEALPGVAVYYEGSTDATMTDAEGAWSIRLLKGKNLTFSLIGMKPQTIRIDSQTTLEVVLEADAMSLEDAVVIGYGKQLRRDLTGSVASIKADDLRKTGSNNALGALQGHVAGLSITSQSGEPGSGFQIKIRGNNSINAGTTPLFVIDGMQMDISSGEIASSSSTGTGSYDPMSFLNPSDIASIEVLKDASATAIYGAQGANGVVIITTKSGTGIGGKTVVNLDASWGLQMVPKYIQMLTPQEYMAYRFNRTDYGWYYYGTDTDGDGVQDTPKDASGFEYFDWQKLLYRNALMKNYNVSVSGRVGKGTQLFASVGFLDQDGLVINNGYDRYNAQLKMDHAINAKVKVGASASFSRSISNGAVASGGGELGNSGLIQMIYLERPLEFWSDSDTDYPKGWTTLQDLVSTETFRRTVYDRTMGNAYFEWNILPELRFRASASGNTSSSNLKEYYSYKSRWGSSRNGYGNYRQVSTYSYNANATLTWNHDFSSGHHLDAMGGVEANLYNTDNMRISGYDFNDGSTKAYDLSKAGIIEDPVQSTTQSTRLSAFGRINYNYKSRYYLTFNLRSDASSKFYEKNRVGWFPSASIAWRPVEEPWMDWSRSWLDNAKVRLSAGASGNDRISTYAALATLTTNYYASGGSEVMGMSPSSTANPKLKWETTWQYDLGLDLTLFGERIDFTGDIYYKDTRDMLYRATLSAQSGFTEQWQNLGRVENKGLELSLTTHNIDTRDFSWSTSFTFDASRNKVLDIGGVEYTSVNIAHGVLANDISRIMVGQPIGIGYGYVWDGNYQLTDFIIKDKFGNDFTEHPEIVTSEDIKQGKLVFTLKDGVTTINGITPQPGDRKYKDLDGDNEITTADRRVISNSNPKWTAGLGNTFTWKGFDLNIFFECVYGRDIMNEFKLRSESGLSGSTMYNNLRKEAWEGHWTPENGSDTYSRLMNQTNTYVSSYYVEDGSFLRLKTVGFGYSLPGRICSRIHFEKLRIYANIDNAWLWTRYSGMDPDVSSSNSLFTGFDRLSYPKARVITFGINASF